MWGLVPTIAVIGLAGAVLGGCATQAQMEATRTAASTREATSAWNTCLVRVQAKPRYARIYEKLGVATLMPSEAQLADTARMTNEDIALGLNWYTEVNECFPPLLEALAKIDQEYVAVFADDERQRTAIVNEIVVAKPTYGNVNREILILATQRKEAVTRVAQRIQARLAASRQQELDEMQAVATSVAELAINSIIALAETQSTLARSSRTFAAARPRYQINRIKIATCSPGVQTALNAAVRDAKINVTSRYAAMGMPTDPSRNSSMAAALADIDRRAAGARAQSC